MTSNNNPLKIEILNPISQENESTQKKKSVAKEMKSSSPSISSSKRKKKKNKKRKNSSISRSRSRSKNRYSRQKPREKSRRKSRSRSRSYSNHRNSRKKHKNYRDREKERDYSRDKIDKRNKRSRSRSSSISSKSSKNQDQEQEKKRSRTRSPPKFLFKRNRSPGGGVLNMMEYEMGKPKYFWDGFQWVARTNSVPNIDPNILNQTRKMRKVQISNLPLYMGLTDNDIKQIVSKFLIDNFLNDVGNYNPIISVNLNHQGNYAILEISSVEETNRLIKIENIKIFNHSCKITRVGESMYGQTLNLQTLVTNAQTTAQAQAAALVALNSLQKKDVNSSFTLGKTNLTPASSVIKVANLIIPEVGRTLTEENYDDILTDIFSMFGKCGTVVNGFIVKPYQSSIGAEVGCVFLEFFDRENAEKAMTELTGKKYNQKEMRLVFIPEDVFNKNFKGLQEIGHHE